MRRITIILLAAAFLLLATSCDMFRHFAEVKVEVLGMSPATVIIKNRNMGTYWPYFTVHRHIVGDEFTTNYRYSVRIFSGMEVTANIYEDGKLLHTETGTSIFWGK